MSLRTFRAWLCRMCCKDQVFNSDMSREIDRLVIENDRLKEKFDEYFLP